MLTHEVRKVEPVSRTVLRNSKERRASPQRSPEERRYSGVEPVMDDRELYDAVPDVLDVEGHL